MNDVLATLQDRHGMAEDEGEYISTYTQGQAWLDSPEEYEITQALSVRTPVVYFFSNEACGEACTGFATKWKDVQKQQIGAGYYRIDIDKNPTAASSEGVTSVPFFKVNYGGDSGLYEGDGSDWATLKEATGEQIKAVRQEIGTTSTTEFLSNFEDEEEAESEAFAEKFVEAI